MIEIGIYKERNPRDKEFHTRESVKSERTPSYIDLARAKSDALVNRLKNKKLNRVMLNSDGNDNGIKINRSN